MLVGGVDVEHILDIKEPPLPLRDPHQLPLVDAEHGDDVQYVLVRLGAVDNDLRLLESGVLVQRDLHGIPPF